MKAFFSTDFMSHVACFLPVGSCVSYTSRTASDQVRLFLMIVKLPAPRQGRGLGPAFGGERISSTSARMDPPLLLRIRNACTTSTHSISVLLRSSSSHNDPAFGHNDPGAPVRSRKVDVSIKIFCMTITEPDHRSDAADSRLFCPQTKSYQPILRTTARCSDGAYKEPFY
jgi:hypothetical protein